MLSKTTRLTIKNNEYLYQQQQNEIRYYQKLKQKLQIILEDILRQKKQIQQKYKIEKQDLIEEINNKNNKIEKLELKIKQLQKENQQIKYQYNQRVSLMNILKQQNWLISKQYTQQKDRIKQSLNYLIRQNQSLKQTIIKKNTLHLENNKYQISNRYFNSPSRINHFQNQQFYSMTDLKSNPYKRILINGLKVSKFNQSSQNQNSIMRDSVFDQSISQPSVVQRLKLRQSQFKQSRITQVKRSGGNNKFYGLQKMSTITHLSRKKTIGHRSND